MQIIGHRGAKGYVMENTLESIKKAIDLGCVFVEIYVQACKSGELYVFHDRTLERLTSKQGVFAEKTATELNQTPLLNGSSIPLLKEVLQHFAGKTSLNIELKSKGTAVKTGEILRQVVTQNSWKTEDFIISSFDHQELELFKNKFPEYKVGVLLYHLPHNLATIGQDLKAYSIHCSIDFISEELVKDAHKKDLRVFVYTINTLVDYRYCKSIGVDGIFSDYPDIFDL